MQGIFTMSAGYLHKQSTKCSVWRRPWRRRSGGPTGRPLFGAAVLARRSREAVARGNWFCWVRDCGSAGGQGGGAQVGRQVQAHAHLGLSAGTSSGQLNLFLYVLIVLRFQFLDLTKQARNMCSTNKATVNYATNTQHFFRFSGTGCFVLDSGQNELVQTLHFELYACSTNAG